MIARGNRDIPARFYLPFAWLMKCGDMIPTHRREYSSAAVGGCDFFHFACSLWLENSEGHLPISNAEVTDGIFGKAIEPFTKGLVVNLLPERQQPFRRFLLPECHRGHGVLR